MLMTLIQLALFAAIYGATGYGLMLVFAKVDSQHPELGGVRSVLQPLSPGHEGGAEGTGVVPDRPHPDRGDGARLPGGGEEVRQGPELRDRHGPLPFVFYPMLGMSDAQYEHQARRRPPRGLIGQRGSRKRRPAGRRKAARVI